MDNYIFCLTLIGITGLAASWIPTLMSSVRISYALLFLLAGIGLYCLTDSLPWPNPLRDEMVTVRLTELIVIIALMGTGLKIDSPFGWKSWKIPFRLIFFTMIISIAGLAILVHWWIGLPIASALLLAAALAPTDPVLASDVQVDAPNKGREDATRFSLTAEAGLNDGMAFPFVWLAVGLAIMAETDEAWLMHWVGYDLFYRIGVGVASGYALGRLVTLLFFHLPEHHNLLKVRDGMVAIASTLFIYGITELLHGYGFLAVFVAALTIRNHELKHEYHATLHTFTDQVERILLGIVLILFGGSLVTGILEPLTWEMAIVGIIFVLIIRPLTGYAAVAGSGLPIAEKLAISFFGIRGVGSFFYLSFGLKEAYFPQEEELWALTAFIVLISLIIHGITAPSAIRYIRNLNSRRHSHLQP